MKVTVAGTTSTTTVQGSFVSPTQGCTVTVYLVGTTTLATLYSDDSGTTLANPFTALTNGQWYFYADTGRYDVRFSNGGITTPFTRGDFPTGGILNAYPANQLPIAGNNGALVRQTDGARGLWLDTGVQWYSTSGQVTNVQGFDARGNGIANDTTPIQNAISAACAVTPPSAVYIPAGNYPVTATLVLCSGLTLYGDGWGSVIRVSGNINGLTLLGVSGSPKSNVTLRDFVVEKIAGSLTTNVGVQLTWVNDAILERVIFRNNGGVMGSAWGCTDCIRFRAVDVQATGMGTNVAYLTTGTGAVSATSGINNAVIRGNYSSSFQGLDIVGQTDFLIDGVIAKSNTSTFAYGIVIEGGTLRGVVTNCVLSSHNYGGLDFEPIATNYDVIVSNNTILSNTRNGIDIQTGGAIFIGNNVSLNTNTGMAFTGGTGAQVIGNTFRANVLTGISVATGQLDSVIGNKFINNGTAAALNSNGTSNTWIGNVYSGNGTNWSGSAAGNISMVADMGLGGYRGVATVTGAATTATITGFSMPDALYQVLCSAGNPVGGPAAGSLRCSITSKTTAQFVITLEAAPGGVATVDVSWFLVR